MSRLKLIADDSIPTEAIVETVAHLGEVLWVSGDKEAAKVVWEKARKDFPKNELLHQVMHRFFCVSHNSCFGDI